MILEATKPVPPVTSSCPAGFFPGHSGQRSICTRKPAQLDQIGFSLTTSKLKQLPLPGVEFEPAAYLQGHAPQRVHERPENLAWMASAR